MIEIRLFIVSMRFTAKVDKKDYKRRNYLIVYLVCSMLTKTVYIKTRAISWN